MNSNDVSVSSNDMSDSEQRLMSLDSSQFENLDKEQYENLTSHISCLISVFEDGEERGVFEKDYFSDECNKLSDVVKQIASRLGFEYSNDKSQDQTPQTQEPASNKKGKSSPDLER